MTPEAFGHSPSFVVREVDAPRPELSAADVSGVYGFVARRVANRADAADIAQQTLLLACAKHSTCRSENHSAWLFAIARHLIVDHYRAKNRFQFVEVTALTATDTAMQTPPDTPAVYEHRERLRFLLDVITRELRLEEQVAVLLADVYAYRDKDSAAALCMSVPCLKLLLHGARVRLHDLLGRNHTPMVKTSAAKGGLANGQVRPAYRTGVTCRLSPPELQALRDKLLVGLRS